MKYIIGLDGGGTKMAAMLADTDGNILKTAKFGPSNVYDLGIEKFGERLAEVPAALGVDAKDVAAVFGGLAGGTNFYTGINEKLSVVFPCAKVDNGNDAENILWQDSDRMTAADSFRAPVRYFLPEAADSFTA